MNQAQATNIPLPDNVISFATTKLHTARAKTQQRAGHLSKWGIRIGLAGWMLVVLASLGLLFHKGDFTVSAAPHLVAQAQSWLNGRLDVTGLLGSQDTISRNGLRYIVYPPMPAILMLPFVAVLGTSFSDIWFIWIIGAVNVVLVYHILDTLSSKGWSLRTQRENIVLAVLFGTGTVALWLAMEGEVWFTSQTSAVMFLLVVILATLRERWWVASLALGLVLLTRSTDVLAGLFTLIFFARTLGNKGKASGGGSLGDVWHDLRSWRPARRPSRSEYLALVVPFAACVAVLLIHNKLYFGSFFSTGYDLQVKQDYPQIHYGVFSWHFLWPNIVADFLNFPSFTFRSSNDVLPHINVLQNGIGTSIFFSTPLFLLFFIPTLTRTPQRWLRVTLWVVVGVMLVPILLFDGTGWYQVGARYLLDIYPFIWMLLAMRANTIGWRWMTLAFASVGINVYLAESFWCNVIYHCLSTSHGSLRKVLFYMIFVVLAACCVGAWWWITNDPARERQSFEFTNQRL
jgi:hypothetical protein